MSIRRRFLEFLALVFLGMAAVPPAVSAQAVHRAGLVVDFGDGRVVVRVVAFSGETISGVELLQQSGLNVAVMTNLGGGAALCAVEEVGCPPTPQDCFCQCRGAGCHYWSYFHLQEGSWVYATVGAAGHLLHDGDVDGWIWGDGRISPAPMTWEEVQARGQPAGPTAAPPPPPSATPRPPTAAPAALPPTVPPTGTAPPGTTVSPTRTRAMPTAPRPTGTSWPSPPATGAPSPSPVAASPSPHPSYPSSPLPSSGGGGGWTALAFGGILVLLLAIWLWVRRRR